MVAVSSPDNDAPGKPCVQCQQRYVAYSNAFYATVVARSVFFPRCQHGPFCAGCKRKVASRTLGACVCRALLEGFREALWPEAEPGDLERAREEMMLRKAPPTTPSPVWTPLEAHRQATDDRRSAAVAALKAAKADIAEEQSLVSQEVRHGPSAEPSEAPAATFKRRAGASAALEEAKSQKLKKRSGAAEPDAPQTRSAAEVAAAVATEAVSKGRFLETASPPRPAKFAPRLPAAKVSTDRQPLKREVSNGTGKVDKKPRLISAGDSDAEEDGSE
ncbi:GIP [Symbiodinium sp. CCMP2592]|nr:GIP [Symbiodinium sp. CCMP2592]